MAAWRAQAPVVAAVALGGAAGASARHGAALLWPTPAGGFPWTTLWVNVTGCALIGVLMVVTDGVRRAHRLVRPFFGTGVLGGFTTFSAYTVDVRTLLAGGRAGAGLACLVLTPLLALAAAGASVWLTRRAVAGRWPR
ncbi:fluoride efflux transporter FluC [Streptomyces sp. NPDC015131]|uniref:fluoride efflux transporter FluC n=1 Tax=Streptomyces sp. NPDC015131 TaxID=3364941 RepID=UPI0036FD0BFA